MLWTRPIGSSWQGPSGRCSREVTFFRSLSSSTCPQRGSSVPTSETFKAGTPSKRGPCAEPFWTWKLLWPYVAYVAHTGKDPKPVPSCVEGSDIACGQQRLSAAPWLHLVPPKVLRAAWAEPQMTMPSGGSLAESTARQAPVLPPDPQGQQVCPAGAGPPSPCCMGPVQPCRARLPRGAGLP